MSNLIQYRLGDVCKVINGRAYTQEELLELGKYKVLRVGNFFSNGSWYYSNSELEENKYCSQGDLLFAWSASFGPKIWNGEKTIFHYHIWKLIVNDNRLHKEYFYYYLKNITQSMLGSTHGSIMLHLTKSYMEDLQLNVPTLLLEQQKIAQILSSLDSKIKLNNSINNELESMVKAIYEYWFVQFDFPNEEGKPYKSSGGKMVWNEKLKKAIPVGWTVDKISSQIGQNKGGDWGKDEPTGNYIKKVSCIRGADISYIKGNNTNSDLPKRYILEKNSHKLLTANDIVIEISGGSPTQSTGRVAMITEKTIERFNNPLICSNFCQAITLKDPNHAGYFFYMWSMFYEQNILFNYEGKTSGIKNFLFDSFVANEWYIPSQTIAHKFQHTIDSIYKKKESLLQQNKHLTACRDWLLPLLMSGQVKVKPQMEESVLDIAAEPVAVYEKVKVKDCTGADIAILAGYIIHKNKNREFGRVKLVKELYLAEQLCELNLHSIFYRNTAGPYDENLVNNAETMLNRYKYYRTEKQRTRNGHSLVCYKEQSAAFEIPLLFEQNFGEKKELIDNLLNKLCKLTGDMNEIIATLFAVWNNRLINKKTVSDNELLKDFYDWSDHKNDFTKDQVMHGLEFMKKEKLIPQGKGKYIDKKE